MKNGSNTLYTFYRKGGITIMTVLGATWVYVSACYGKVMDMIFRIFVEAFKSNNTDLYENI